jgi:hypothetical protein
MKKIIITTCISLFISASGLAYADSSANNFYVGAGFNRVDLGYNDNPDGLIGNPKNYLLDAGYNFTSNYAVEIQYSDSYKDSAIPYRTGDFTTTPPTFYNRAAEMSLQTSAIYGVYRSSNNLFWKAKIGYMRNKVSIKDNHPAFPFHTSFSESNWAAGLGAGYRFGRSSIELEYTTTDDEINIDFTSLAYNYAF